MRCSLNIKADNGKSSLLYKDLVRVSNNPSTAVDSYYYIKSDKFKEVYGDWENGKVAKNMLDVNGEPKYSEIGDMDLDIDYATIELDNRAESYKKLLEVYPTIKNKINKEVKRLTALGGQQRSLKNMKSLLQKLEEGSLDLSIPMYLNMSAKHIQGMYNRIKIEAANTGSDMNKMALIYKNSKSYSIITEIADALTDTGEIAELIDSSEATKKALHNMHNIEVIYLKESKKYLTERLNANNPTWAKADIKKWLDGSTDIKSHEQYLEYMGDSSDKLLANVANIVMNTEHQSREAAISFNERLDTKLTQLEKSMSSTGNAEALFSDIMYTKDNGEVHIYDIYAQNTQGKSPLEDIQYHKVEEIKRSKPELYEFLKFFTKEYITLNAGLPAGEQMGTRIPTVLKPTRERAQGTSIKESVKSVYDDAKKSLERSSLDMERGMQLDDAGEPIKRVPIFYTKKYDSIDYKAAFKLKYDEIIKQGEDVDSANEIADKYASLIATKKNAELISKDLAYSLQSFHAMAINYSSKMAVMDVVESAMAVVESPLRSYHKRDGSGKIILNKSTGDTEISQKVTGVQAKAAAGLKTFLNMHYYGQKEKDLGSVDIGGYQADVNKTLRWLNKYTSWVQMSVNSFAAVAGLGTGEANMLVEANSRDIFTRKNLVKAGGIYRRGMGRYMADIGRRVPRSFLGLMGEKYNMMMDFQPKGNIKATENTSAKRLLKTSIAFFMQNGVEHISQTRASLAVMDGFKTYNEDGSETGKTLLDAHKEVDGKLVIDDVYIKEKDGSIVKYDQKQRYRVSNKMAATIRKMLGNYSSLTANNAKRHAVGALVLKYRDWAYEGIANRFGTLQPYENLEMSREGYYRTGGRVIKETIKDLRRLEFSLAKENWTNLTPEEQANIRRLVTEAAMITALAVGGALMGKAGKLVEDEYPDDTFEHKMVRGSFNFMVYEVNRLFTEVAAFADPREALRLSVNPVPASSMVKSTWQLWAQLATGPTERYKTGWRKGDLKLEARVEKLIPIYKNIKVLNPEGIKDKGVFYNMN